MAFWGRTQRAWLHFIAGEFVAARTILTQQNDGMSDPAARAAIRAACATAMPEDPHSLILAELAVSLGYLGYVDAARERAREALSEARQLRPLNNPVILITSSPHNLCHAWHIVEDRVMSSPPWNTAAYWREAAVQTRKLVDDVKDAPTRAMILRAAAE